MCHISIAYDFYTEMESSTRSESLVAPVGMYQLSPVIADRAVFCKILCLEIDFLQWINQNVWECTGEHGKLSAFSIVGTKR